MDELTPLAAIEDIKLLKARYFRSINTKDRALLRSILADDAVVDYRGAATDLRTGINHVPSATEAPIAGADAITETVMQSIAPLISVHHGCMPEIIVTGEDRAEAIWAMTDRLQPAASGPFDEMIGWGHYHETYKKNGGAWKIKTLRLTRLRVDVR
jgi:hypothetical protein